MAKVNTQLTISMTTQTSTPVVEMTQGDNGRGLDIFITDDITTSGSGTVDSTLSATLYAEKPSGLKSSISASQILKYEGSDTYEIIFNGSDDFANIIAEVGITKAQIVLMSNEEHVTSFTINIKVVESIALATSLDSISNFGDIISLYNSLEDMKETMDNYISQFENQLKLTVNVRYGTTDPTVESTDKDGDLYIKVK